MAKVRKRYDPKKGLRAASHLAEDYVVWSVDGFGGGVKSLSTFNDVRISRYLERILMETKHNFTFIVGAVARDMDGYEWLELDELQSSYCAGPELTEHLKDHAVRVAKRIPDGELLTTFYYATARQDYTFQDHILWNWLRSLGVMSQLITRKEHELNNFLDEQEKSMNVIQSLKEARLSAGMKQKDVAKELGQSCAHVSGIESGKHNISPATHDKLCDIFDSRGVDTLHLRKAFFKERVGKLFDIPSDYAALKVFEDLFQLLQDKVITYKGHLYEQA